MDVAFEQKVRERAYEIWKAAGQEDGLADLHWLSAEQAVMKESGSKTMAASGAKRVVKAAKPSADKTMAKGGKRKAA